MTTFRVLDFETTGFCKKNQVCNPAHQVIESGFYDVVCEQNIFYLGNSAQAFFKPTRPVDTEARAVHHITDDLLQDGLSQENLEDFLHVNSPDYFVAHSADFDMSFFDQKGVPVICTYKCCLRSWPDSPSHKNQVVRYYLDIKLDADKCEPSHRSMPDAYVTSHILIELLKKHDKEQLVQWTKEPRYLARCPFGKYSGKDWGDIPADYLQWANKQVDFDEDVKHAVRLELSKR